MRIAATLCLLALGLSGSACATPLAGDPPAAKSPESGSADVQTAVEVSVLANGAKFIGDGTGGAEVVISDARTGEELARGVTTGGTGNTDRIMDDSGGRHERVVTPGAAVFRTNLSLERPRLVDVMVQGPLDHPLASSQASSQFWLMPGNDLVGDSRIVLTLSGYIVEIKDLAVNAAGTGRVTMDIAMLCGCPVRPGGLWNADSIDMSASLVTAGGIRETVKLAYSGEGNRFVAEFAGKTRQPRRLEIRLSGQQDTNASFVVIPIMD